jgi:hypothetical protein
MIDILRIPIPKERLNSIPENERALFFLLGYAANQIIMFQKLLLFAVNSPTNESVEGQVHGVQIEMLLRLMVGIIWETWNLITKRFIQQPIGREYQDLLDDAGKRALSDLKKQFGKSNLIATLRNNFAFHLPKTEEMEAAFKAAYNDPNFDEEWNLYFSRDKFNSLYLLSDIVLIHAIFNSIDESDFAAGQRRIMQEVTAAANGMVEFIHAFTTALWKRHIAPHMDATVCATIENAPGIFEVQLPFFVELSDRPRESGAKNLNERA